MKLFPKKHSLTTDVYDIIYFALKDSGLTIHEISVTKDRFDDKINIGAKVSRDGKSESFFAVG